jgi:hypothetical protein
MGVIKAGDPDNTLLPWDIVTRDYLRQKSAQEEIE